LPSFEREELSAHQGKQG